MGWWIEDHTADVILVVEADDIKGLFEEAVRGLASYIAGKELDCINSEKKKKISVSAPDIDLLIADFLNEVLIRSIIDKVLYCGVNVMDLTTGEENKVTAEIYGIQTDWEHDVKAITYHDLKLERTKDGIYKFRCILDI